jgi:predicted enzyme related to lactoylglutathione lyase
MARLPKHAINWFDIPVADMERARLFYGAVLGNEPALVEDTPPEFPMAMFAVAEPGEGIISGALVMSNEATGQTPGGATTVYFNVEDVEAALSRVEAAGGKIQEPAFDTPFGKIAYITDSEGNRVGIHEHALHPVQ